MTDFGSVLIQGFDKRGLNETAKISDPVKGAGLIPRANGIQTVQIQTINFSGSVVFEGTLTAEPDGIWFPLTVNNTMTSTQSIQLDYSWDQTKSKETNDFFTIIGQYSWIRANVSNVSTGILDSIKLAV